MNRSIILRVGTALLLLCTVFSVRGDVERDQATEAKGLFINVETISRLGDDEQKEHIRQLYQEVFPRLIGLRVSGLALPGPSIHRERLDVPPEKLAETILEQKNGGWPWLVREATEVCCKVLAKNRGSLSPFVRADLQSKNVRDKKRALQVIGDLRMDEFFDSVLRIFESDKELSARAAFVLRDIRDPRAIAPMVKKNPDLATNMISDLLQNLQTGNKADPSLVELLKSNDPEVRWRAAYALSESGDSCLVPQVARLAKDIDDRVRKNAANIGFCMKGSAFGDVRPVLVSLLSDSSVKVRSFTARCFADRKDTVCAHALLELVQDSSMDELEHSTVVQAIQNLTGSYFRYQVGSDAWKPTTDNNKEAIKRFAAWIKENAANQQFKDDAQSRAP